MGGNPNISPVESAALMKMQQDGVSSDEAVNMINQHRQETPTEPVNKPDNRPAWKKL